MTPIPNSYSKRGFVYKLISRKNMVAIYEQWCGHDLYAYEVVKIRNRKARKIKDVLIQAAEQLPNDEDWGTYGKTYSTGNGGPVAAIRAAEAQMAEWVSVAASKAV